MPKANRIGEENDGWTVAKYLLEFERGGNAFTPPLKAALQRLLKMAEAERADDGGRLIDDPTFRGQIAELEAVTSPRAGSTFLAENYSGLPLASWREPV